MADHFGDYQRIRDESAARPSKPAKPEVSALLTIIALLVEKLDRSGALDRIEIHNALKAAYNELPDENRREAEILRLLSIRITPPG